MNFSDIAGEFGLALNEVESNLNFLLASFRLRPRLYPLLDKSVLDPYSKQLVDDFLKQKEAVLTSQYRGMVVVISGAFEQFVRKIIEKAVTSFNSLQAGFDALPEKIRVQNVIRTGRALAKFQEPLDHAPLDYQVLVERLVSCRSKSVKYSLNHEVFAYFISSITPRHLEEILSWVDVSLSWDEVGSNPGIEKLFGARGARESGKAAAVYLDKFTKLRNNVAHIGVGGLTVAETDITEFIKFFRIFSDCIASQVAARVKKQIGSVRADGASPIKR